jgi:hypothetical protein
MEPLTIDSVRAEQPSKIKIQMKAHQLAVVQAMINHEKTEHYKCDNGDEYRFNMGVLCDPVGSGKSISILGLIAAGNNTFPEERKYITGDNFVTTHLKQLNDHTEVQYKKSEYAKNYTKPTTIPIDIIIVAHTIVKQWAKYISDQTNLKCLLINSKKTLDALRFNKTDVSRTTQEILDEFAKYDMILISSTRLRPFCRGIPIHFPAYRYNRIIIDEADSINIPSDTINGQFSWYITSSYKTLQHPGGEIKYKDENGNITDSRFWATTRIVIRGITDRHNIRAVFNPIYGNPGYGKVVNKLIYFRNDDEFIKSSFLLDEPILNIIKCLNPVALNVLKGIVDDNIISLINAGNVAGAIEQITCTKATTENLTEAVTNKLQVELKNEKIRYTMKSQMQYSCQLSKELALKKSMKRQDALINKIELIKTRLIENSQCPICFDEPANRTITNCCKNTFCFECITISMKHNPKCPHCRANLTPGDLIIMVDEVSDAAPAADEAGPLEKNATLEKLLTEIFDRPEQAKVLIFSEHENIFITVGEFLTYKGIQNSRVIGSSATIASTLNKFKTDTLDVLLLNSRHCGSGLNIENATDVIIYHSMSPELEMQVIGRAQRPGRTSTLNIWKLLHENETTT